MTDKPEPIATPVRFDLLVALLPELEERAGVRSVLGFYDDDLAGRLYNVAHTAGCIYKNFDWPSWKNDAEYLTKPGEVERADLDTCCKLLTVIVRQERFSENSLCGHIGSGFAARLVRRIGELAPKDGSDIDDAPAPWRPKEGPPCPACASPAVIPIIRGMPTREADDAAARGEAVIGGCRVSDDSTTWRCKACAHEFGRFGDWDEETTDG